MSGAPLLFSLASATKLIQAEVLEGRDLSLAASYLCASASPRVLVVKDPRPFPALDAALADFLSGRESLVLDQMVPNPRSSDIMDMAVRARAFAPDLVVGAGGGSALDSAKAVCVLVNNEGDLDEYLGPQATRRLSRRGPKSLLVPTTAGTGSEATKFGVYSARSGRKYSLADPLIQADAAILADSLVAELPPALLASTAYDAITHALEPLWNKNATPLSDALATEALVELLKRFRPAYLARLSGSSAGTGELLAAASAAGAAFNTTGTAAIHALSFVLSEEWHVPHGAACAFFAEAVYDRNSADGGVAAKLAAAARQAFPGGCGAPGDDAAAAKRLRAELADLKRLTGLPARFADLGADAAALTPARIAELFDKCQADFKMKNNVPPMDAETVRALVEAML